MLIREAKQVRGSMLAPLRELIVRWRAILSVDIHLKERMFLQRWLSLKSWGRYLVVKSSGEQKYQGETGDTGDNMQTYLMTDISTQ